MSTRLLLIAGAAGLALSGCSTPTSPTRNLFRTGQDARVYNPMTGRYEWPDEPEPEHHSRTSVETRDAYRKSREPSPPTPGAGDERIYNPQSGRFEPAR